MARKLDQKSNPEIRNIDFIIYEEGEKKSRNSDLFLATSIKVKLNYYILNYENCDS
jgi:hypothetical protein